MTSGAGQIVERRRHRRFKASEGAYAALSPDSSKVGPIVDISVDGLCFRYIVHDSQPKEPVETHIYVGDNGFYLEKMPYETVEDVEVRNVSSLSSLIMRQRRVKFVGLSPNQRAQLQYFIQHRTFEKDENMGVRGLPLRTLDRK
ncbi:MAG: PilZ domain-containing protein [Desulfobacterales bacterium]|nr:PilZ domain-containing protein [Desulfobacterales bacterium]